MGSVQPMLAVAAVPGPSSGLPLDAAQWAYEVKWDGMRVLVDVGEGVLRVRSRTGRDVTVAFPELAALAATGPAATGSSGADGSAASGVAGRDAVLDGEVVVLRAGRPSFAAVADRFHVGDAQRAAALAATAPVTLMIFDLLRLDGRDLTGLPWHERRALLDALAPDGPAWRLSPVYDDGEALLAATAEQGLEGVMAKRRDSRYAPGARSTDWLKVAHRRTQACVVGGWRPETGTQGRIGALLLGVWLDSPGGPRLRFAGRVGSGIGAAAQRELSSLLGGLAVPDPPFADPVAWDDARSATWVRPVVVVEVRHKGRTDGGRLREPVFRGLRTDVPPEDVRDE